MNEAQQALIAAVWKLLDENGGDLDAARDQFENALSAWTPEG